MLLPVSILTAAAAEVLVDKAAVLASLPRAPWDTVSEPARQGALDAAWLTISMQPGYNLMSAAGDMPVRLATVVEALVRLTLCEDAAAAGRSKLAAQGVGSVSLGSVSESYGRRPALHPATRALLQPYTGTVRMA